MHRLSRARHQGAPGARRRGRWPVRCRSPRAQSGPRRVRAPAPGLPRSRSGQRQPRSRIAHAGRSIPYYRAAAIALCLARALVPGQPSTLGRASRARSRHPVRYLGLNRVIFRAFIIRVRVFIRAFIRAFRPALSRSLDVLAGITATHALDITRRTHVASEQRKHFSESSAGRQRPSNHRVDTASPAVCR